MIGGAIAARLGVGFSIPAGGVLAFIGYLLCMFLQADRLWLLYLAFAIAGLGVGFVYNGVISAVVPRFPDRKGFASGVLLMGFGASSLVIGTAASNLIASPTFGWHLTYLLTGVLILVSAVVGRFFVLPPKAVPGAQKEPERGLTPMQMLRTGRFWLFFAGVLIGTGFGSGMIAHGSYIFTEGGASPELAAVCVGLVSVMNGLGRIVFGALHDRLGFRVSLPLDAGLFIVCGAVAGAVHHVGAHLCAHCGHDAHRRVLWGSAHHIFVRGRGVLRQAPLRAEPELVEPQHPGRRICLDCCGWHTDLNGLLCRGLLALYGA